MAWYVDISPAWSIGCPGLPDSSGGLRAGAHAIAGGLALAQTYLNAKR